MSKNNIIEIRGLVFNRESKNIFDEVNLDIERGKITAIMGPSGTGKTTLLHLIGKKLIPEQGDIFFEGMNLSQMRKKDLFHFRKNIGMMFQNNALFTDINVLENVAFPLREHTKLPNKTIEDICLMKLESVGLRGASKLMPDQLSGGMARRVALARATALDPKIMMLDEPFTGQDPISMGILVQLIRLLNDALGMTTLLVSHNIHETLGIADHVYLFEGGKIVGSGSPKELINSQDIWIRQFIQGLPDGPIPFRYPGPKFMEELNL